MTMIGKTMETKISSRANVQVRPQASRRGRHAKRMLALLTSTALIAANPAFAQSIPNALPTGGNVAAGSVTIGAPSSNGLVINQTSGSAVINWNSYNIGAGNTVTYVQPDAASAVLNRVTGAATTTIAGSIIANGQVYIVNPNGIAITSTGTVNAGAFVASTLDIGDDDFMAGRRTFTGNGASKEVSNAGQITIDRGGYMALIGGSVDNSGTITVPMGRAALGSGESATLDLSGDGFLQVAIPTTAEGTKALVSNSGRIAASGGAVQLKAAAAREMARQAVNMSGTVEAKGVSGTSGDIVLSGGEGEVHVSGKVDASNSTGKGGKVTVTGRSIKLASAKIDASGKTGGGRVKIGGDRQGNGTTQRAATLAVDAATSIDADAISTGHGGDVVLWSDDLTSFAGTITARGGALSGNGGEVEVSGKALLSYTGLTDLTAANGSFGNLLLDPYNVTISTGADTTSGGFTASGDDSVINVSTLTNALSLANVAVTTGDSSSAGFQLGNITVAAPISWAAGTTLSLTAAERIDINAAITASTGGLTLNAGGAISATAGVSIGGIFNLASGSWMQSAASLPSFYAKDFQLNGGTFLRVAGGNGTSEATAYRLADVYGLQGLSSSIGTHWALANDIDASGTVNWRGGRGFKSIPTWFSGTFDGKDHAISGLTIVNPDDIGGLFDGIGTDGVVRNLRIVDATIVTTGMDTGILASRNEGVIFNVHTSGTVSGSRSISNSVNIGGLVGVNAGLISASDSAATVTGTRGVVIGGLVGRALNFFPNSRIENSQATGAVSGGNSSTVGGLVGSSEVTISNSYATGAVNGSDSYVGGLVGISTGMTISNSYATGAVRAGSSTVGGLVGFNRSAISNSYATGSVSVDDMSIAGGLVGNNAGSVHSSYASGAVSGINDSYSGGLVGWSEIGATVTSSFWDTETTGKSNACGRGACWTTDLTTSQARMASSYSGWDFSTVWYQAGDMRPILRSEAATADANGVITITNLHQLALMGTDLSGRYRLAADIDATATAGTNTADIWGEGGWVPVGVSGTRFSGKLDGAGHVINGLTINRRSTQGVGLFGYTTSNASLSNLELVGGAINGAHNVGALVGRNGGTISNAYATGAVTGSSSLGGLVGENEEGSSISNAYATGTVAGDTYAGGLVGFNYGTVSNAYATGSVTGSTDIGGLIGHNTGTISNAYATGTAAGGSYAGGLTGLNYGTISNAYATGAVTGDSFIGGLVGWNRGTITAAFWNTETSGRSVGCFGSSNCLEYGLTTAQMNNPTNFINAGWDYASNWGTLKTGGTPVLRALSAGPLFSYYVVLSGNTSTTYGDGITSTSGITVGGGGAANVTLGWGSAIGTTTNAGTYGYGDAGVLAFTYSVGNASDYYVDYGTNALTVNQRTITVTANAATKTYGDVNPTLTYSVTGLANNDELTGALATSATQYSNVGTYGIAQGTLAASSNYIISSYTGADLTINKRTLRVTANAISKTYGDTNPALTYMATGLVNDDELSGSISVAATQYSDVGAYGVSQGTLAASSNYAIDYTGADLTINQRALTVTAHAATKTYGDANPTLAYTATGLVNNDQLSGALTTSATQYSDVGAYGITQGTLANGNYAIAYNAADLSINQRALTVTANAASKTYGDANPELTYTATGLVNNDELSGALATSATQYSNIGAYAIDQGTLANGNYAIAYNSADLTINQRALTVTALAQSKTYGDANPALTYMAIGLVNNDELSGELVTSATQYSDVGAYGIGQGTLAASSNYAIDYTGANLTINQRALTVTAHVASKTYGDANPTLTYTATGLVNNDELSGALATSATQYSNVGAYAIDQGTLAASGNYAINYTGADITIGKRSITVTADAASKTYGDLNPTLTYAAIGLVNNDTLSGVITTSAGQYSSVGSYGITIGTLAASSNYSIDYTGADLTIDKRTLSVVASAVTRAYGDANPSLSYAATGLVNNDTLSGTLSTTADSRSDVGTYVITQGTLGNDNYDIDYTSADLSVTARNLSVTAHNLNRYYGSSNPILTYTAIGLVNDDMLSGALATLADRSSTAGAYDITQGTLAASANYSLSFNPGTLTVDMLLSPPAGTMASSADAGRGSRGNAGRSTFDTGRFAAFATASSTPSQSEDGADIVLNDPRFDGTVICLDGGGCVTAP